MAEALRLYGEDVIKTGVTTVGTRILFPTVVEAYNYLNRQGTMPHRLAYYIESQRGNFWNLKTIEEFYKGSGAPWTTHSTGGEMLWLNGMCNEIWDSVVNEVCMGPDMPNASAEVKAKERCPSPGTKPWESYRSAIVNGWRPVQAHGTSSHGARLYIQMLEQAMEEGNFSLEYMRGLRTTLEHNILLGNVPDVIAGLKKFGVIINVNMGMLGGVPLNMKVYGPELEEFAMPVKTWIDEGIRVTFEGGGNWRPIHTLGTFVLGSEPFGITHDRGHIWVTQRQSNTVTKLRASDGEIVGVFAVGKVPVAVVSDGTDLWIANRDGHTVNKMQSDGTILETIEVGKTPVGLTFDGKNIWVGCFRSDAVWKLRPSDGAILGTFPAGERPRSQIAYDGTYMWVTNSAGHTVTKLRASDGSARGDDCGRKRPRAVVFDGSRIWVGNYLGNSVTRIEVE